MEIGHDASQALSLCSQANPAQIEALAMASISVVLGSQREESALVGPVFEDLDVDFIKRTYSSLVCFYLEASKHDLSSSELLSFLRTECGLSESDGEILCRVFQENKQELRALLSVTADHSYLPQLLGVDWRLDYCVSASEDRAAREFLYHVSLRTADGITGKEEQIKFACSVEELQDLVSRLKEACKSVERAVDRRLSYSSP